MSIEEQGDYQEVAGLEPDEAFKWWERYLLPSEAGQAIRAGLTLDEARKRRREDAAAESKRRDGPSSQPAAAGIQVATDQANSSDREQEIRALALLAATRAESEAARLQDDGRRAAARVTSIIAQGEDIEVMYDQVAVLTFLRRRPHALSAESADDTLVVLTLAELLGVCASSGTRALEIVPLDFADATTLLADPSYVEVTARIGSQHDDREFVINGVCHTADERGGFGPVVYEPGAATARPPNATPGARGCTEPNSVRLTIGDEQVELPLADVADRLEHVADHDEWLEAIDADISVVGHLLDLLGTALGHQEPEVLLNGWEVCWARTSEGGVAVVPAEDMPGVIEIAAASASWLPGGPVQFDQHEGIYCFGDRYWVRTNGDSNTDCVYVGRFESPAAAWEAAVGASTYFRLISPGRAVCDLDVVGRVD